MAKNLRIVLAQINLFVGDIDGNLKKMIESAEFARDQLAAHCIVFPELSLSGYPPDDLLLRKSFIEDCAQALQIFKDTVKNIYCIVGHPYPTPQGLHNSCSIIYNGVILGRYGKQNLPNYGVFDECRYFVPGNSSCIIPINGIPVGLIVCEDIWASNPIEHAAHAGARIILVPNASPFETDKHELRHALLAKRAKSAKVPVVYANLIGQQDDISFDGGSLVVDAQGKICQFAGFFNENLLPVDFEITAAETKVSESPFYIPSYEQRIYDCLVLGVRDYLAKNKFSGALVGLSGGLDSALTLAIAVDALGKDQVNAVILPSRFTADMSVEDAVSLSKNLGVKYDIISIEPVFQAFLDSLASHLDLSTPNLTQENIQARCRGILLMAFSNQSGRILLNTSNRSELAVGYGTLYGDMIGGFAVLKDITKTRVYSLARYRNQINSVIPARTIDRAPTAELAENQKDEDTLPPYDTLDKILALYLNQEWSPEEIIAQGMDQTVVEKVIHSIKKSEYKRRQAPIGNRINQKSFGRDRRYPISSGYKK